LLAKRGQCENFLHALPSSQSIAEGPVAFAHLGSHRDASVPSRQGSIAGRRHGQFTPLPGAGPRTPQTLMFPRP
jgi:hypothetical protein